MSNIRVLPASQFSVDQWADWEKIQAGVPGLDSAFFHPELTRLTSQVREDVEVAVIENGRTSVGFFPFQRGPRGIAQAVTGRLSEFHGVIVDPSAQWTPSELMRTCGLSSWHFDHLPVTQAHFQPYVWSQSGSPYMDLSRGYEAYRTEQRSKGSSLAQAERKSRKLAREVGPLRFEFHTDEAEVFSSLLEWKTAQHDRTGVLSVLHVEWVTALLGKLAQVQGNNFGGLLSSLYAGDELVAVHLGLYSRAALHIWFPAYDCHYERYSPGLILLLELARAAADRGFHRIDFGRGSERYKANFKSGDIPIAEGSVDRRLVTRNIHRSWHDTKQWMRSSPWGKQLEKPLNATRRLRQWFAFR
jgi:CelD/BcsL family acetyltransferase involved in cellulose biosynthesis